MPGSTSWPTASRRGATLDATTFGKWGPELAAAVGAGPLVLAGVSTDCCVLSTALAAADAGMAVQVVADACAGVTDESHERPWPSCGCTRRWSRSSRLADVGTPLPPPPSHPRDPGDRIRPGPGARRPVRAGIGDALGMPTQSLPRAQIVARYGPLIDGFAPGPPDHPLAAGLPAGTVTDDTEQAVLLGQLLVETGGEPDPAELARRLVDWERGVAARGSLDLLGPSTRRAIATLEAGAAPAEAGRLGTTNGAACASPPGGRRHPGGRPHPARQPGRRRQPGQPQHRRGPGRRGRRGRRRQRRPSTGLTAARPSPWASPPRSAPPPAATGVAAADVASRITWATRLVAGLRADDVLDVIYRVVGTSLATQESVPAAFAVLRRQPRRSLARLPDRCLPGRRLRHHRCHGRSHGRREPRRRRPSLPARPAPRSTG